MASYVPNEELSSQQEGDAPAQSVPPAEDDDRLPTYAELYPNDSRPHGAFGTPPDTPPHDIEIGRAHV